MSTEFTTPAKFLVVTNTKQGTRIHRITCKRKGDGTPLDMAAPQDIAVATPASCCRPKGADEYINNANDPDPLEVAEPVKAAKPEPVKPEAKVPESKSHSRTIFLAESKVAKHYWDVSRPAAVEIAEALGATVEASSKDLSIRVLSSISNADAKRVADAIESCWQQGYAEFKEWKKTDADYRSLPMSHDPKSDRCKAERVHLAAFAQARAAELSDGVL
jgi:hypothetical protein